ncbi:hypothetical protein E2562_011111 [Oryza meyeriana var. granulata]|uniref:Uncharacterized protein n=1 Tax=Oryza meyeriana var. granulata TaxID=110450 RepID=A0A6G1EWM2_9ORYZ|nr:hypothetical protein E2562_011111 [Oryza meyeriana var. granulata]
MVVELALDDKEVHGLDLSSDYSLPLPLPDLGNEGWDTDDERFFGDGLLPPPGSDEEEPEEEEEEAPSARRRTAETRLPTRPRGTEVAANTLEATGREGAEASVAEAAIGAEEEAGAEDTEDNTVEVVAEADEEEAGVVICLREVSHM